MFLIIYFAVRLAITPLLHKQDELPVDEHELSLVKLRDIDVFSVKELDEVLNLYKEKDIKTKSVEQYEKFASVLNELKEFQYLTYEEYLSKMEKLNQYYNIG
jgi:hypothetical protein